ncbi:uncharacterized protein RAG0_15448 [Rhynchosporium agropyri]|uniref:C2H2-type domain-containing protein n=1 Tax=Rhynchosporium agropyri TaxID=914238 RepID=A0A1E1LL87_9HELO|nr:uncharacterized protein RAG0_15448 [Rhynchosporium agropyri]
MNVRCPNLEKQRSTEYYCGLEAGSPTSPVSSLSSENSASTSGSQKGHRLKPSQWRFLAWVAVTRNNNRRIPRKERYICPMNGCEELERGFLSPEAMHIHLKNSACISQGAYRCFGTQKLVRIGKCHCRDCVELKGRLARMSSSFESLKRSLSGRSSRSQQFDYEDFRSEPSHLEECPKDSENPVAIMQNSDTSLNNHMSCAEFGDTGILEAADSGIFELNPASKDSAYQFNIYTTGPFELEQQQQDADKTLDVSDGCYHETFHGHDLSSKELNGQIQFHQEDDVMNQEIFDWRPESPIGHCYGDNIFHQGDGMFTNDPLSYDNHFMAAIPERGTGVAYEMTSTSPCQYQGQPSILSLATAHEGLQYSDKLLTSHTSDLSLDEPPPSQGSHKRRKYKNFRSNSRHVDAAGVSSDDIDTPSYGFSSSRVVPAQGNAWTQSFAQDTSLVSKAIPSRLLNSTNVNAPSHISATTPPPSSQPTTSQTPRSFQESSSGKVNCKYCFLACDMSNRSRHEKSCKSSPYLTNAPRFPCHYPGCTSTFGRKDNLTHHQRTQKHDVSIENVELKFSLTPTPGSPLWDLAMQGLRQKCGDNTMGGQKDEFGMDNVDNNDDILI